MIPSNSPSSSPSELPSSIPSSLPSSFPSSMPSKAPTPLPTPVPTPAPTLECYGPDNCSNGAACFSNNCATSLSFHLSWDGNDNHDFLVILPDRSSVFWGNTSSGSCSLSGDVDPGLNFDDSSTTLFTEIITCTDPPPGLYEYITVNSSYFRGNYDPYKVSVYVDGVLQHEADYTSNSGWRTFTL